MIKRVKKKIKMEVGLNLPISCAAFIAVDIRGSRNNLKTTFFCSIFLTERT